MCRTLSLVTYRELYLSVKWMNLVNLQVALRIPLYANLSLRSEQQNSKTASHIYKCTPISYSIPQHYTKNPTKYAKVHMHTRLTPLDKDSRNRAYVDPSRHVLHRLLCPSFRSCPSPTNGVATPCTPKAQNALSQPEHQLCFFSRYCVQFVLRIQ